MKIILLGFPKSGTSSFQTLFKQLGYKTVHWKVNGNFIGKIIKTNKDNKKRLLTGLDQYDCITQLDVCVSKNDAYWPQIVDYKQLYDENKNVVFILNTREPSKVLSSFKRWNKYNQRMHSFNQEILKDLKDETFINVLQTHNNNIISFFESKPNAKFIVYDIEKDSMDKLRKYINIPPNVVNFPHKNHNTK